MTGLVEPTVTVEMVVWSGDAPRHRIPVERALVLLAQALSENGHDPVRAAEALRGAFDSLKQMA